MQKTINLAENTQKRQKQKFNHFGTFKNFDGTYKHARQCIDCNSTKLTPERARIYRCNACRLKRIKERALYYPIGNQGNKA